MTPSPSKISENQNSEHIGQAENMQPLFFRGNIEKSLELNA